MAGVIIEMVGSSAGLTADNNAEITRKYAVTGSNSAEEAVIDLRNYLLLTIGNPPTIGALVLDQISDAEQVEGVYFSTATWRTFARRSAPSIGESQFNFEIGLESVKVQAAVGGIVTYKAPTASNWTPEKINDQGDGSDVDGVDIFEPIYEESETHWIRISDLTPSYRQAIRGVVGRVNNSPFKGYEAGEVLCRGVSGSRRGAQDSEVTFRWAVRQNQPDLTLGEVTGINKKGWDYLWPRFANVRESSGSPSRKKITHVSVASVFLTADFSALGIGTE